MDAPFAYVAEKDGAFMAAWTSRMSPEDQGDAFAEMTSVGATIRTMQTREDYLKWLETVN